MEAKLSVGDMVVRKEGGGFVMVATQENDAGKLFCVSVDQSKTIRAWFDPAVLKKVRRRAIRVSFG